MNGHASATRVALIHDYLAQAGGAERVVEALHGLFPDAPIYTSVYDRDATLACFATMDIRTSFLQSWPTATRRLHKLALAYYPSAFEGFDLGGYDLVVSSSSAFAKGILTPPETCHVCYCHTPARFAWRPHEYLRQSRRTRILTPILRGLLSNLRLWDLASAQRVDYFIANSHNVARRIQKYYGRTAAVIHPPVRTEKYQPAARHEVGPHFLVVSRLLGYKRVDLAVRACNALKAPLRIVGVGPEMEALKRQAGETIQFLGRLSDAEVAMEYARCRALIFPGEEDFGLTPVECMASGRPVVAYGAGGALETVVDGQTGLFFRAQTEDALAAALSAVGSIEWAPEALQAHAMRFDLPVFHAQMRRFTLAALADHRERYAADKNTGAPEGRAALDGHGLPAWEAGRAWTP